MAREREQPAEQEEQPEENGGGVERMDAPNQQAVGQPHPSEEGTGGEEGDITAANHVFDDQAADQPDTGETDATAEEEKKPRGGRQKKSG